MLFPRSRDRDVRTHPSGPMQNLRDLAKHGCGFAFEPPRHVRRRKNGGQSIRVLFSELVHMPPLGFSTILYKKEAIVVPLVN